MKKSRVSGFTFVEVVVATSIVVALAAVMFQFLTSGQLFSAGSEAQLQAQERVRMVLVYILRELREADASTAYIRMNGGDCVHDGAAFNGNSIRFRKPCLRNDSGYNIVSLTSDGEVEFGAEGSSGFQEGLEIEYTLANEQVMRRVWNGANLEKETVITGDIIALAFRAFLQNQPRQVEIIVTGRGRDVSRREEVTSQASSEVVFRN